MIKSNRAKSTARKPLVDISNGERPSTVSKKKSPTDAVVYGGGAVDRLLLARFELSNLFGQIDELVAQAMESKRIDRKASQDVESFRNVLSDMHSSLKPWISRLRQAFSSTSSTLATGENQLCPADDAKATSRINKNEEENAFFNGNETELDVIVSPSPLVSWRAGACAGAYTSESGKQLFLLTPLLKSKAASSKSMVKILHDKNQHATLGLPQPASDDLLGAAKMEIRPANVTKPRIAESDTNTSRSRSVAPVKCKGKNGLESSKPKSPAVPENSDPSGSDDLNDNALNDLTLRYQQLLGLDPSKNFTNRRKEVSHTLDWFLSPPKTCVIMEPTDEKPLPTPANGGMLFPAAPLWNDLESTVCKGKRPGESTLKKELWDRFEEASKDGLQFDASIFQRTERKVFLDMLEEACEASDSERGGDGK